MKLVDIHYTKKGSEICVSSSKYNSLIDLLVRLEREKEAMEKHIVIAKKLFFSLFKVLFVLTLFHSPVIAEPFNSLKKTYDDVFISPYERARREIESCIRSNEDGITRAYYQLQSYSERLELFQHFKSKGWRVVWLGDTHIYLSKIASH